MPKGYVTPREVICGGCREPFMATGTRSRFCSRKCVDKEQWDRKKRKEVKCKECGIVVTRNYSRSFCSPECKNKWYGNTEPNGKVFYYMARYHLTKEQYDKMVADQDGKCAICKSGEPLHVDHDHACCPKRGYSCGKCIRGLLCNSCNNGLGRFKDSIEALESAVAYLKKFA